MFNLKDNDVILFQGDSITDGNRGRSEDPNHIHGHGYQYILASEIYADNLNKNISIINRGVSRNRIADLYGRWKEDCLILKPTVLSILIGINDIWAMWDGESGSSPERYEKIYHLLLDEVLSENPDTLIVIMEPFFGESQNAAFNEYCKCHIKDYSDAAKRVATDYGAVFVELQDLFLEYVTYEEINKMNLLDKY